MEKKVISFEELSRYIGEKFIGFKFKKEKSPSDSIIGYIKYNNEMDKFINKELTIFGFDFHHQCFTIKDSNTSWSYPAHYVIEQITQKNKTDIELAKDVLSILSKIK